MIGHSERGRASASAGMQGSNQAEASARWPFVAATILSGVLFWFWLASGSLTAIRPNAYGAVSELAQVADVDIPRALQTMDEASDFLVQFEKNKKSCPLQLAWVSVMRMAEEPTTIRLRSGSYFSPLFALSDAPQRIALPYPAPYETGHGVLTAMIISGRAMIALTPHWLVTAQHGGTTGEVYWLPHNSCRPEHG
jgi:hypothetical protein